MDFMLPSPEQGLYGLRALKTVGMADGALDQSEIAMLHAARELTGATCDIDALEPIEPDALAAAITDAQLRWQLVSAMVVMSMVDQDADEREIERIEAFARALRVDNNAVATARHLAHDQMLLVRFDIVRRFWAVEKIVQNIRERGLRALWETIQAARRKYENPELAARYQALAALPPDTLGRAYYESMRENGFPLPGEPGAAAETITYHDMTHVLGGYGTTPDEEILVASFSAGFRKKNPMSFILFVMCQFHLGIPIAPGVPPERGLFDPRAVLQAVRRGAAMNVDLSDDWEYWPVIDQPVDALRKRYNIQPR